MAWRTVVISNPAKLRIENNQLVVAQDEIIPLPVEDIAALVIESPEVSITSAAMYRLAQAGVHLIVCDEKHMPCLSGLPFDSHSRLAGTQRLQLGLSEPFKKRCWQLVVRQKVMNQAQCLDLVGRPGSAYLRNLAQDTKSGDSTYIESNAARFYFGALFGDDFKRGEEDTLNAALDYGYAIIRAVVARALAGHGFLLSQGIHHRSELNAFNLADDFIEPLRPIIDLYTAQFLEPGGALGRTQRQELVSLVGSDVRIDGKLQVLNHGVEIMTSSFVTACRSKYAADLKLPYLIPLREHRYE